MSSKVFFALFPTNWGVTDRAKLHAFLLCVTGVKLLPSLSLSFCAGRHSTAHWTRAPHPKAAYPAPTITLYWGCTIPKMTSRSEKQVLLALIFCVATVFAVTLGPFFFHILPYDLFNEHPVHPAVLHLSLYVQCWREAGVALGVWTCKAAGRRQQSCVSKCEVFSQSQS